ncbi:hypothetical protein [Natrinema pallidum]|uniref:Uncharacterized protein n=1 Tax=Natrinema pallidum TaxID=69527 RepID=A0A4P9TG08_9EURY|nr:hypothetical protein [Natrinema pallidum]QCW03776.1 hypothetical protein FGF80_11245 [Natrinema pallidum]
MLVRQTNDDVIINNQVTYEGNDYRMVGHATNYEVIMENNETVYKSGKTSGYRSGTITGINDSGWTSCVDLNGKGLEYSMFQAAGDSGSVPFILREGLSDDPMEITTGLATLGRTRTGNSIRCDGNSYTGYEKTAGVSAEAISNHMGGSFYFG